MKNLRTLIESSKSPQQISGVLLKESSVLIKLNQLSFLSDEEKKVWGLLNATRTRDAINIAVIRFGEQIVSGIEDNFGKYTFLNSIITSMEITPCIAWSSIEFNLRFNCIDFSKVKELIPELPTEFTSKLVDKFGKINEYLLGELLFKFATSGIKLGGNSSISDGDWGGDGSYPRFAKRVYAHFSSLQTDAKEAYQKFLDMIRSNSDPEPEVEDWTKGGDFWKDPKKELKRAFQGSGFKLTKVFDVEDRGNPRGIPGADYGLRFVVDGVTYEVSVTDFDEVSGHGDEYDQGDFSPENLFYNSDGQEMTADDIVSAFKSGTQEDEGIYVVK